MGGVFFVTCKKFRTFAYHIIKQTDMKRVFICIFLCGLTYMVMLPKIVGDISLNKGK